MADMTNAYENDTINAMRGTAVAAWTPFAGLLTVVTDKEAGTVTEISYTGYARASVTWAAPSAGLTSNANLLSFGKMTGGTGGTVNAVGIYTAASGGTLRYIITQSPGKVVAVNGTPEYAIGALTLEHK